MKSDRWLPMCSCVWRVCHLIYTSHPAFSWLFILFEATLHTPRKHSYTRRLIPFPPQDASLFWMTWMDVVLSASQRNGIFFRSTSGIWSQGHISDLSLEFLHFSNLKSLYARKTLTTVCQYSSCLVLQLPFHLLETQRGSWAVDPWVFSPPSCSPPSHLCCSDARPRPWAVTHSLARTLKAFPFPVLVLLSALPAKCSHDFTSALHILRPPGSTSTCRLCGQLSVWLWPALSHIL